MATMIGAAIGGRLGRSKRQASDPAEPGRDRAQRKRGKEQLQVTLARQGTPSLPGADVRWTDLSPNGNMVEYQVIGGVLQITYVSEPGWDNVDAPTPELRLKVAFHRLLASPPWGPLFRAALESTRHNLCRIQKAAQTQSAPRDDKTRIFSPAVLGPSAKPVLAIDIVEESLDVERFRQLCNEYNYTGPEPKIYGEESLHNSSLDVSLERCPFLLTDTVDGTDDVEQGTRYWCSTKVISNPSESCILGAFVGLAGGLTDDTICFAMNDLVGKCVYRRGVPASVSPEVIPLSGPSGLTSLSESLVAFYGQKPARLRAIAEDKQVRAMLARMSQSGRERIRTQGGQPMMMSLVDRRGHRQVDAVFEKRGQAPHDVIAGLQIAKMAGATLCDLQGRPLDLCAALHRPADPTSRLKYVLAGSPELAKEICSYLGASDRARWSLSRVFGLRWARPKLSAA